VTVELPCRYRIESSVRSASRVVNVLVVVHTDDGLHGSSYVAAFTQAQARAVHAMLDELEPRILGLPVTDTGIAWDRMRRACRLVGVSGPATWALSALDVALWDAKAKLFDAPLHAVLGTAQRELPAYASDGCWLTADLDEAVEQAAGFAAEGFRAIKVRAGRMDAEEDLAVLEAIRRTVGDDVDLLVDVNQGWSLPVARRLGRVLVEQGGRGRSPLLRVPKAEQRELMRAQFTEDLKAVAKLSAKLAARS
jgi:L-alanine-DL-glutamate epimerase-like enolase superfamily enzyme